MTRTQLLIFILSGAGIGVAVWFLSLVMPIYRMAKGTVRGLLSSILALFGIVIATNLFWIITLALPPVLRAEGGRLYPYVLGGFLVISVLPLVASIYAWQKIRG